MGHRRQENNCYDIQLRVYQALTLAFQPREGEGENLRLMAKYAYWDGKYVGAPAFGNIEFMVAKHWQDLICIRHHTLYTALNLTTLYVFEYRDSRDFFNPLGSYPT